MHNKHTMTIMTLAISSIALLGSGCGAAHKQNAAVDLTETMKQSLVYLDISNSGYDQYQPWKQTPIAKEGGYGCAVGPYEILTTAENAMNATLIQARCYAQNEFIPATVKVVDFEYNLCLLTLDEKALKVPLTPISFTEQYPKGKEITTCWLSSGSYLTTARSTLDRAELRYSDISFVKNLYYLATNVSRIFGDGEVCFTGNDAIGMACWGVDSDAGIIPSETINKFLNEAKKETYSGFGQVGFRIFPLLDPTMRRFLKMPEEMDDGVYVSTVYNLGTGSDELQAGDVILAIDGRQLDPYGRYEHPEYDRISFENIILQKSDGDVLQFDLWRQGQAQTVEVVAKNFKANEMLVPYYQYGKQPEYVVLGGFIFQNLTRDYLTMWGEGWTGKVPPHLYHYYSDLSFDPTPERRDIVVLNYVLPTESNLGYQQLSRLIVRAVNGNPVKSIKDILDAAESPDNAEFLVFDFEMNSPQIVIKKSDLQIESMKVAQMYGIPKLNHIE